MSTLPTITGGPAAVSRAAAAPAAPTTIVVNRRFYRMVCGVAAGASAILLLVIGANGAHNAPDATPGHTTSVSATVTAQRGPNASERSRWATAQQVSSTPCWAEWNDIQNGFEILCDANPSVRSTPTAQPVR